MPSTKTPSKRKLGTVTDDEKDPKKAKGNYLTSALLDLIAVSLLFDTNGGAVLVCNLSSASSEPWYRDRSRARAGPGGRGTAGSRRRHPGEEEACSCVSPRRYCASCSWRDAHRVCQRLWLCM